MVRSAEKSISNACSQSLTVWLEPWCDELNLPPRSYISVQPIAFEGIEVILPEFEIADDRIIVWAAGPGTIVATIDGVVQDTGSRTIDLSPEMFEIPVKAFVGLAFGDYPEARPGGSPTQVKQSIWARLFGR